MGLPVAFGDGLGNDEAQSFLLDHDGDRCQLGEVSVAGTGDRDEDELPGLQDGGELGEQRLVGAVVLRLAALRDVLGRLRSAADATDSPAATAAASRDRGLRRRAGRGRPGPPGSRR